MEKFCTLVFVLFSITLSAQFTIENFTSADGLASDDVNCVTIDDLGNLWFGTNEGISRFDGTNWLTFNLGNSPGLADDNITAIFFDNDKNLWVGTDFGVSTFDGNNWRTYTEDEGLIDNRVTSINSGEEGIIWIGNRDGVTLREGNEMISLGMSDGMPFGGVTSISFDNVSNNKYFGTALGGVVKFNGVDLLPFHANIGLLSDIITSIAIDENDNKWVGTSAGVSVLDERDSLVMNYSRIFELPAPDTLNPVEDVKIDSKGRVWAGVYVDYLVTEGGVSVYDGIEWINIDVEDGLIGPVVRQLAIDENDDVWVVTSTGVSKITFPLSPPTSTKNLIPETFKVFPNPVSDNLTIELQPEISNRLVSVYNAFGQIIARDIIPNGLNQFSIPMNQHATGLYFVEIDNQIMKVIKE